MMLYRTLFSLALLLSIACVGVAIGENPVPGGDTQHPLGQKGEAGPQGPPGSVGPSGDRGSTDESLPDSASSACSPATTGGETSEVDGRTCDSHTVSTTVPSGGGHGSSSGGGSGGQGARQQVQDTLVGRTDENRAGSGTAEDLVDPEKNNKAQPDSKEQSKQLKEADKAAESPSVGDKRDAENTDSQTDARVTTQSTGTLTEGSQSEEPSAPTQQTNTSDTSSGSSSAENAVSSDAATDVSNAATSSEESESTSNPDNAGNADTTTTTTTTTIPPELTNNKKGDADSSSSISSSVWVRVPLLIVVTLACILVC